MGTKRIISILATVIFGVLFPGYIALHLWTAYLFYQHWGFFLGVLAFLLPPFSEIAAGIACFYWHQWYYVLAVIAGLVSCAGLDFAENKTALSGRGLVIACFTWVLVLAGVLGGFLYVAIPNGFGPTSGTATDRSQLEDCAVAVLASLHASDSDDPSALANLVTAKKGLKDTIRGYDKASMDELCSIVDESLRFERSLQNDLLAYMEELIRTGRTSKFKIGDRTRQALDRLPNKLRILYRTNYIEAGEAEIEKQFGPNASTIAEMGKDLWGPVYNRFAHTWTVYGQTYKEVLGRPMPALADPPPPPGRAARQPEVQSRIRFPISYQSISPYQSVTTQTDRFGRPGGPTVFGLGCKPPERMSL